MLLLELHLRTARLAELRLFYGEVLGLRILHESAVEFTVQAGSTAIRFTPVDDGSQPFYHLAFNIPENKLAAAMDWMAQRAALLPIEGSGGPVADFAGWNAHAIYFLDPAGNILEFIARHSLPNAAPGGFSAADLLCASEIALVVPDVPATAADLKQRFDLDGYGDSSEDFAAIGDEHGLFIVVKTGRPWFPTRVRPAEVFPTAVVIDASGFARIQLGDLPNRIESAPARIRSSTR